MLLLVHMARFFRADFPKYDGENRSIPATAAPPVAANSIGGALTVIADHVVSNSINIFVDATYSEVRCTYAIVMLDAAGCFVYARSGSSSASSVLHAELLAILEGLKFISRRCFTAAHIYTDSMLAVTYLHSDSSNWSWDTAFTLRCCHLCWLNDYTTIKHTPRQYNMLAHTLAQSADSSTAANDFA